MGELSKYHDFENDLCTIAQEITNFGIIYDKVKDSLEMSLSQEFASLLLNKIIRRIVEFYKHLFKNDEAYTNYQSQESALRRNNDTDRVFPLDAVELQHFKNETDMDTGGVLIHTGPYANEYARSFNALALVFANEIYFRNNAFTTYTEEGRKTIAHELTHVAQHKEGRIENSTRNELEEEAESNEALAGYNDNEYIIFRISSMLCRIKKEEIKTFISKVADEFERKLSMKKYELADEEYLTLLHEYSKMLKGA
jgi:hypothetical protein